MRTSCKIVAVICSAFVFACALFLGVRASYPRPYAQIVRSSGVPWQLAYAVMKAESNFEETAVSRAGALGVMQLRVSTAEFICRRQSLPFDPEKLLNGEYNVTLGCAYLHYLLERCQDVFTAVCAFNAGEGRVRGWLADSACSDDGKTLGFVPYGETRAYAKKVLEFRKIYDFFYG